MRVNWVHAEECAAKAHIKNFHMRDMPQQRHAVHSATCWGLRTDGCVRNIHTQGECWRQTRAFVAWNFTSILWSTRLCHANKSLCNLFKYHYSVFLLDRKLFW